MPCTCRREVFPDGILYASKDSHYSVFKAARMYRMEAVKIDTLLSGEIDCADFERKLAERRDKPAILNVNIGMYQYVYSLFVATIFCNFFPIHVLSVHMV